MEEKKYYTPDIEEFHIGFNFEAKVADTEDQWLKMVYSYPSDWIFNITDDGETKRLAEKPVPDCLRVKYLNKEDIEELGWTFGYIADEECNIVDGYDLTINAKESYSLYFEAGKLIIALVIQENEVGQSFNVCFRGNCRNKSELKKIMQMLGIPVKVNP